jgi:hypothetical protein
MKENEEIVVVKRPNLYHRGGFKQNALFSLEIHENIITIINKSLYQFTVHVGEKLER